jgi:hypothetical protein
MEIKRTTLPPFGGPREESGANGSLWSMGGKIIGSPADGVVVPNIVGLSPIEAIDLLTSLGLAHDTGQSIYVGATQENNGMVASQSLTAGTLVNVGSTVTYSTFSYSLSTVPNLIGQPAGNANSILASVGLIGLPETTTEGATAENNGLIGLQQPAAGTMVAPGTSVNYLVYDYVLPVVGPTTNWYVDPMSSAIRFPGITQLPAELNNPTQYKLVLSGGSIDGEWVLPSNVSISPMWGMLYVQWPSMTSNKPGGMGSAGQFAGTTFDLNTGSPSTVVDNAIATIVAI